MHRSALRFHSCCQTKLREFSCNIYVRHLSSAGSVPVANSDQQAIGSLEPWHISGVKALANNEKKAKDIIVDDLSATLEAHRASNRSAVIRRVNAAGVSRTFSRLLREQDIDGGDEVEKIHEKKENLPRQMWPADSVQAKERYGKTGSRGFVKRKTGDPFEYTGAVQFLKQPWKSNGTYKDMEMQRPWLAYIETTSEDDLGRLTSEIKAYEAYMKLSPQEEAASQLVISDVNSVPRNEPGMKPLTLLGSRSTGLATPISDFDFSFAPPNSLPGGWILPDGGNNISQSQQSDHKKKLEAVKALEKLCRRFRSSNRFRNTEFVRHARVPIIRSTHVATGLDIQIQAMAEYQAAQEYAVAYLSEFPSLRPLYIALRYCLELRDLTTVFMGGLGSYSILMMIVTAMKHSSGKFALDDLGGQLLHVLDFYGNADLYKFGFSADPPLVFEKQKEGWSLAERMARADDSQLTAIDQMRKFYPRKPYLLCLQDPANDLNDLGKNAYAIKHIQATFNQIQESIQSALETKNRMSHNDRARDRMWSYLDPLVRADYRAFELHRSRVERCVGSRKIVEPDCSNEMIRKEFEKRVKRYKGVEEENDDLSETAVDAIVGNTFKSIEAEDSLHDGTRLARCRKELTRAHDNAYKIKRKQAKEKALEKAFAATKKKLQKLQGINDDEYGWKSSSTNDQTTLLEAIAAPRSALAARTSPPKSIPRVPTQNQNGGTKPSRVLNPPQ